jgi:hypothetical protein
MTTQRRAQSQQRRSRWSGFLGDVQNEATTFKEILREAAARKDQSNRDYAECAQRSFNAIHNVVRKKPDPARMTPNHFSRLPGFRPPPSDSPRSMVSGQGYEYDTSPPMRDRWPKRPITRNSLRILNPTRLNDYPAIVRPKDVACVMGAYVNPAAEWI